MDAQGMYAVAHERGDSGVDQPVALELRTPPECRRNQVYGEVPALACACMSGVARAVVDDLQ